MQYHNSTTIVPEIPSAKEEREEKLEYAFNSLLDLPPLIRFTYVKNGLNWLRNLKKRGIAHKIIGFYLTDNYIYILAKLAKETQCCGIPVTHRCKIWLWSSTREAAATDFCISEIHKHTQK